MGAVGLKTLILQTVSSLRKQLRPWHTPAFGDGDPVTLLSVLARVCHPLGQTIHLRKPLLETNQCSNSWTVLSKALGNFLSLLPEEIIL